MYTDADFSEKPHFECIALLPKSIGAGKTEEKYTIQPPPRFAQRVFFCLFTNTRRTFARVLYVLAAVVVATHKYYNSVNHPSKENLVLDVFYNIAISRVGRSQREKGSPSDRRLCELAMPAREEPRREKRASNLSADVGRRHSKPEHNNSPGGGWGDHTHRARVNLRKARKALREHRARRTMTTKTRAVGIENNNKIKYYTKMK